MVKYMHTRVCYSTAICQRCNLDRWTNEKKFGVLFTGGKPAMKIDELVNKWEI